MKILKRVTLAALLGLSLIPLRLATAQTGEMPVKLVILEPAPSGSEVKSTTCTTTTCTTTIVRN